MKEMVLIGHVKTRWYHFIKMHSEIGSLPTKSIRRDHAMKWRINYTAIELQRDLDKMVFGDDRRWFEASMTGEEKFARWSAVVDEIKAGIKA